MREIAYRHDAHIQIYPTTKGWTVRAIYWKAYPRGFTQKRWPCHPYPAADHKTTGLKEAVDMAYEWLETELLEG